MPLATPWWLSNSGDGVAFAAAVGCWSVGLGWCPAIPRRAGSPALHLFRVDLGGRLGLEREPICKKTDDISQQQSFPNGKTLQNRPVVHDSAIAYSVVKHG
jgi:hypothetical protein